MLRERTIAVLIATLVAFTAAADDLVVTRASISPSSTLPAMPVWISFEVQNTTDHLVTVPMSYIVEITSPAGESFLGWNDTTCVRPLPPVYGTLPPLAPGATRVIDFQTGSALAVTIFANQRLWQPGTWHFRVILSGELRDDRLTRVHWDGLMAAGYITAPPLVTPAMTLTIEQPKGVDSDAWKALLGARAVTSLLGPKGGEISKRLWSQYGDSRYAPYFGLAAAQHILQYGGEERFAIVNAIYERVIAIDRDRIFNDELRQGPALGTALHAASADNLASAIRLTNEARDQLENLAKIATHELTRVTARQELQKLKSPEELKEKYAPSADRQ